MDLTPRNPVIDARGVYKLSYDVLAESFPPLHFDVELNVTGDFKTIGAKVIA